MILNCFNLIRFIEEEFESMLKNERREWSQEDWESLGKIIKYFEEGYDWLVLTCY